MQLRDTLHVYFTDGDPPTATATNTACYHDQHRGHCEWGGHRDRALQDGLHTDRSLLRRELQPVRLTFGAAGAAANLGTGTYRLRVGDQYQVDSTPK